MRLSRCIAVAAAVALTATALLGQVMLPHRRAFSQPSPYPPYMGDLLLWLSGESFKSSAEGTPIALWTDLTGNGNNYTNATAGERPTYTLQGASTVLPYAVKFNWISNQHLTQVTTSTQWWNSGYAAFHAFFVLTSDTNEAVPTSGGLHNWTYRDGASGTMSPNLYPQNDTKIITRFATKADSGVLQYNAQNPTNNIAAWHRMDEWTAANDYALYMTDTLQYSTNVNAVEWGSYGHAQATIGKSWLVTALPSTTLYYYNGGIAEVLLYARKLNTTERAAVNTWLDNKYQGIGNNETNVAAGLTNGLVSYWRMDETSGTRTDVLGVNDLTANNTPGNTTGVITNAVTFVSASSQSLSKTDNSSFDPLTNAMSFAFWFRTTTLAGARSALGKDDFSGQRQFLFDVSSSKMVFYAFTNNTTAVALTANTFGNLSINTWYFCVGTWSREDGRMFLRINNAYDTVLGAAEVPIKTSPLAFAQGNKWDGYIDEVGMWSRVLTAKERSYLYNNGAGRTYPFTP